MRRENIKDRRDKRKKIRPDVTSQHELLSLLLDCANDIEQILLEIKQTLETKNTLMRPEQLQLKPKEFGIRDRIIKIVKGAKS